MRRLANQRHTDMVEARHVPTTSRLLYSNLLAICFALICAGLDVPGGCLLLGLFLFVLKALYRLRFVDLLLIWLVVGQIPVPDLNVGRLPDVSLNRIFMVLLGLDLLHGWFFRRFRIVSNLMDRMFVLFLLTAGLSIALTFMTGPPLRRLSDSQLIPFLFYCGTKNHYKEKDFFAKLYQSIILMLVLSGTVGLLEKALGYNLFGVEWANWTVTDDLFRINGFFGDPEPFGISTVVILLPLIGLSGSFAMRGIQSLFKRVALVFSVSCIFLTLTRGVWLAFVAGWGYLSLKQRPVRLVIALLLAIPIIAIALPTDSSLYERRVGNVGTIQARIATYQKAWRMFVDNPWFGAGFGCFTETGERNPYRYDIEYKGHKSVATAHNSFLTVLSETGLVGFFFYTSFFLSVFVACHKIRRSSGDPVYSAFADAATAVALAYMFDGLVHSWVKNPMYLNKALFFMFGIVSGLYDQSLAADAESRNGRLRRLTVRPERQRPIVKRTLVSSRDRGSSSGRVS